jgi:hypothetical protein
VVEEAAGAHESGELAQTAADVPAQEIDDARQDETAIAAAGVGLALTDVAVRNRGLWSVVAAGAGIVGLHAANRRKRKREEAEQAAADELFGTDDLEGAGGPEDDELSEEFYMPPPVPTSADLDALCEALFNGEPESVTFPIDSPSRFVAPTCGVTAAIPRVVRTGSTPRTEASIFIDRSLCRACGDANGLRNMAAELGTRRLYVYEQLLSGTSVYRIDF